MKFPRWLIQNNYLDIKIAVPLKDNGVPEDSTQYYDGTVEAKVYRKLRSRINAFTAVVGNLQPILAQVPTFIEQAAMSADPEEEDVLMSEFDNLLTAPSRLSIEEMVQININADIAEIQKPIATAPFTLESIEKLFTTSTILQSKGITFTQSQPQIWELVYKQQNYTVTFYPDIYDEKPSLRLMNFGEPLFEKLLSTLVQIKT